MKFSKLAILLDEVLAKSKIRVIKFVMFTKISMQTISIILKLNPRSKIRPADVAMFYEVLFHQLNAPFSTKYAIHNILLAPAWSAPKAPALPVPGTYEIKTPGQF